MYNVLIILSTGIKDQMLKQYYCQFFLYMTLTD